MKNLILFFSISVSVIFSCKKEKISTPTDYTFNYTEPVNNPQGDLDLDCPTSQIEYVYPDTYLYSRAIFNPTNPNQIAYLRRPVGAGECNDELWTFNFKTGRTHKVTSEKVCKFDWSILNWIVFANLSTKVHKVRPNGNELTQIRPSNSYSYLLKCNNLGNKILIDGPSTFSFGTPKAVYDFDGDFIQDVPPLEFIYSEICDWYGNQVVFPRQTPPGRFDKYNFLTDTIETIETGETSFSYGNNIQFLNNHEILFTLEKSIYKMDLDTKEKTLIKANGENDWFGQADISIDQKTILLQKRDFVKYDECTIQERTYLALIDIDGSNERKILIPE